jgi:hypothetical protein
LAESCQRAEAWSRDELLALAVARGCRPYASFAPAAQVIPQPELPHEILGCALLRGAADAETFRSIRVGAMVLADLSNSPETMAGAAHFFGVEDRLAHLARLGFAVDIEKDFWADILARLPCAENQGDDFFLPGASRLSFETPRTGPRGAASRVWLRTHHRR